VAADSGDLEQARHRRARPDDHRKAPVELLPCIQKRCKAARVDERHLCEIQYDADRAECLG
jgi:hypothetical protein